MARVLFLTSFVLFSTVAFRAHAQQPSFDPTDLKVCSKALHVPLTGRCKLEHDARCLTDKNIYFKCALLDQKYERVGFAQIRQSLKERSAEEAAAYDRLLATFRTFKKLHQKNEGCHLGTWCGMWHEQDTAAMDHQFLLVAQGEKASTPIPKPNLQDADAALTRRFLAWLKDSDHVKTCPLHQPEAPGSCVSYSDIQATESAWIRYRDAWAAYAKLRWPDGDIDYVLLQLTLQRTRSIRESM